MTQRFQITYCDICGKVGNPKDFQQHRTGFIHKVSSNLPRYKVPFLCLDCEKKNFSQKEMLTKQAKFQKLWKIMVTGFEAQIKLTFNKAANGKEEDEK